MFLSRENAQHIADELKSVIAKDINVIDKDGLIIASTDPARIGCIHTGALRLIQENLQVVTINDFDAVDGAREGINLPITLDGKTVGVIGITGAPSEVSALGTVIKKMTELMVTNLHQREVAAEIENAKSFFYECWLFSDTTNLQELEARSALLHVNMHTPRVVAIMDISGDASGSDLAQEMQIAQIHSYIKKRIDQDPQNFCFLTRRRAVVILNSSSGQNVYTFVSDMVRDVESFFSVSLWCGLSTAASEYMGLKQCYREAETACAAAKQHGKEHIVIYDNLSLDFVLQCLPAQLQWNLHEHIFSGLSEGEKAEILQTIEAYFKAEGDIDRAADNMFVHKNTLYYRIKRIRQLTGYSLRKPAEAFLLYIACSCGAGDAEQETVRQ